MKTQDQIISEMQCEIEQLKRVRDRHHKMIESIASVFGEEGCVKILNAVRIAIEEELAE